MPADLRWMPKAQLRRLLKALLSTRKVSRVVTPGGVAPRGYPPSRKCRDPKFQSLVEEDWGRVLELASLVTAYETHPFVVDLSVPGEESSYTPDVLVWFGDHGAVMEIKPANKLRSRKVAARLEAVNRGLAAHGIGLVLALDEDARANGLQRRLKVLQRLRPARGHWREAIDCAAWDPERGTNVPDEVAALWVEAKSECDALLRRVMRRDPGELLSCPTA